MVPFLTGEQVETAVAKEGSSSGQPAGLPSLERRVQRMRPEPFAAGTRQSGAGVWPRSAPLAWKTVAPGERDILLCRTFPTCWTGHAGIVSPLGWRVRTPWPRSDG